ncbi:MAG: alanyl-tRNA synthetase, partial [Amphiamblys sp. WSBS2006]
MWTVSKIRKSFIDHFTKKHDHTYIPSSPVFLKNDPGLLFVNSGMVQFKDIFRGQIDGTSGLSKVRRAVNTQRCIRAGGKHNDLEDVGRDSYHHTYFEMLGTWSFGDYFKKEAIAMIWDCLLNVFGLDQGKLYVTYFSGCEAMGLGPDTETEAIWRSIGVSEDRIIGCG